MHFKFIITIILFNILCAQSLLNRAVGSESLFGSSKSYAMGLTHSINANNSSIIRYNPSLLKLATENNKLLTDFQINSIFIQERRSIIVKDYFGDFLTFADYVNNNNNFYHFQGGLIANLNQKVRLGVSVLPLASFNYNYTEEIRGSADIEDGDVGFKDPLVGYQIFKTSGTLNTLSIGASYSFNISNHHFFNWGISYNKFLNMEINDDIHVDSLSTEIQNLSLIQDFDTTYNFENLGSYNTMGFSFGNNELLLSFSIEPDVLIQKSHEPFNFIDSIGVISYLDSSNTQFIMRGLNYYKPEKLFIGLSYNSNSNKNLTVSTELQYNKFYKYSNYLKDHQIYKFGFEYILPSKTPIRAGLAYKTSPIVLMPAQSIVTCGTGGNFKNLFYDLAMSYTLFDYYYPDLFPLSQNLEGFERITESKLDIGITVRYLFK